MKSDIMFPAAEGGRRTGLLLPLGTPMGEASREVLTGVEDRFGDARPPCVTLGSCNASGVEALR